MFCSCLFFQFDQKTKKKHVKVIVKWYSYSYGAVKQIPEGVAKLS